MSTEKRRSKPRLTEKVLRGLKRLADHAFAMYLDSALEENPKAWDDCERAQEWLDDMEAYRRGCKEVAK